MKKFAMKSVVAAVGALSALAVQAAPVSLDATSPTTVKYASEQNISTSLSLRDGAAADQRATATLGASFGTDVVGYVRVDIAGGVFAATPTVTVPTRTVTVAQTGSNYVVYSISPAAGASLASADVVTIDTDGGAGTDGITVTNKNGVTLQYRLFETLTAAVNPSAINTLKDTGAKPYASFTAALSNTVTALSAVADVAASPSYTQFTGAATTKAIAKLDVTVNEGVALASGAAATPAGLLTGNSDLTIEGDFNLAKNDAGTFTGAALARVFLDQTSSACGAGTVNATALSATTATFTDVPAATLAGTAATPISHWVCLTAEGTPEINAATYNASVAYAAQTGFTVANVSGAAAGTITRNGVRMVAPLVNQPTDWFSRLVMTNTGSAARSYTITYLAEDGTTISATGAGSSGSLAAGKTTVINLPTVLTITGGAPRGSLVVTVNAPQSEIDGLYQIVEPTGKSIANYILSYKN